MAYSIEQMEKAYAAGYQYQATRGFCPQCVLAALQDAIGGVDETVFRAAQGLSGGTASCGSGTCGALAGGILMIGTRFGRSREAFDQDDADRRISQISKELTDRFLITYGDYTCAGIQKSCLGRSFNLWDAAEKQLFNDLGGHSEVCGAVVGNAAKWTIEILNQYEVTD
mgnify:CR=1 FL=1